MSRTWCDRCDEVGKAAEGAVRWEVDMGQVCWAVLVLVLSGVTAVGASCSICKVQAHQGKKTAQQGSTSQSDTMSIMRVFTSMIAHCMLAYGSCQ